MYTVLEWQESASYCVDLPTYSFPSLYPNTRFIFFHSLFRPPKRPIILCIYFLSLCTLLSVISMHWLRVSTIIPILFSLLIYFVTVIFNLLTIHSTQLVTHRPVTSPFIMRKQESDAFPRRILDRGTDQFYTPLSNCFWLLLRCTILWSWPLFLSKFRQAHHTSWGLPLIEMVQYYWCSQMKWKPLSSTVCTGRGSQKYNS